MRPLFPTVHVFMRLKSGAVPPIPNGSFSLLRYYSGRHGPAIRLPNGQQEGAPILHHDRVRHRFGPVPVENGPSLSNTLIFRPLSRLYVENAELGQSDTLSRQLYRKVDTEPWFKRPSHPYCFLGDVVGVHDRTLGVYSVKDPEGNLCLVAIDFGMSPDNEVLAIRRKIVIGGSIAILNPIAYAFRDGETEFSLEGVGILDLKMDSDSQYNYVVRSAPWETLVFKSNLSALYKANQMIHNSASWEIRCNGCGEKAQNEDDMTLCGQCRFKKYCKSCKLDRLSSVPPRSCRKEQDLCVALKEVRRLLNRKWGNKGSVGRDGFPVQLGRRVQRRQTIASIFSGIKRSRR